MSDSKENVNDGKPTELTFAIGESINGFKLVKKIDEGGFGQVFKVTNDDKTFYAMKLESNFQEGGSAIKLEINVLNQLPKDTVFPKFICGGKKIRFHYLVLELLGDNLKTLKARSVNPEVWSDGTWSRIGIQCLYAMKKMHEAGFVHRDLKPNNFAIGLNTANEIRSRRVLLFDFGLARKFIQRKSGSAISKRTEKQKFKLKTTQSRPTTGPSRQLKKKQSKHCRNRQAEQKKLVENITHQVLTGPRGIPDVSQRTAEERPDEELFEFRKPRPHTDFRGTHQYASPNAHLLKELGRHDDIWSLMYMIAEFFVELPWSNNEDIPVEDLKNQASLLRIFSDEKNPGRLTSEMRRQLNEIDRMLKSLNYYEYPNYELVYQFLRDSMIKSKVDWDTPFDWELTGSSEKARSNGNRQAKQDTWKNPKNFFKVSRWEKLPMPTISPPASTKTLPNTVSRYKKADFEKHGKQMSKEDSADGEEVNPVVKAPTPAQKSLRNLPDATESKKG
ncbi:unnamed protein product [Caenorhabditis brenneri]